MEVKRQPEMEIVVRKIDDLIFSEYNPRQMTNSQAKSLKDSIKRFGLVDPIIVNRHPDRDNIVVGGHMRLRIAAELGIEEVPTVEVNLPLDREKELNIRLNKNTGEWDWSLLADNFELPDLKDWGFDEDELFAGMGLETPEPPGGLTDDDAVPEVTEPVCKSGDLWLLGEHRLLCGDCTVKANVERLMGGEKAALCLTDPPYGVKWDYNSIDDTKENLADLVKGAVPIMLESADVVFITCGLSNQRLYPEPIWMLGWFHPTGTGRSPWGFCCWQPVLVYGKDPYLANGLGSRPDAFTIQDAPPDIDHPCPKPMKIWEWLLERGSIRQGDLILDPFLGSGTTLIACEKLGRRCRGMEIDPHYCTVILQRWADFTGNDPVREDGLKFSDAQLLVEEGCDTTDDETCDTIDADGEQEPRDE